MEYLTQKVKDTVLKPYFERQNINPTPEQLENIEFFLKATAKVESDERLDAENSVSSASGLYQYVDAAVITATNRLSRYDSLSGEEWVNDLKSGKLKITDLNKEQQTIVLLGDLMERKGTDARMNKVLKGDIEAMKKFYYEEHHTAPDDATRKRVDNFFSKKKSITNENKERVDKQFITTDISIEDVEPKREETSIINETTGLIKDKVDDLINNNKTKTTKKEYDTALDNQIEQVDKFLGAGRKMFNDIKNTIDKTATKAIEPQRLDFLDSLAEFVDNIDNIEDEEMFKDFSIYKPFAEEIIKKEKDSIEKDIQKGTGYNDEEYKNLETVKENIRKENPDFTEDDVEEVASQEYNFYRRQVKENNIKSFNNNISQALEQTVPKNLFGEIEGKPDVETASMKLYDKMTSLTTSPKFLANTYSTELIKKELEQKRKQVSENNIRKRRGALEAQRYAAQNSLIGNTVKEIYFDYKELSQKEDDEWRNDVESLNIIEIKNKYPFLQNVSEAMVENIIKDTPNADSAELRANYHVELNKLQNEANIGDTATTQFINNLTGSLIGDAPLLLAYGGAVNGLNAIGRGLKLSEKTTNYMSLNLLSPTSTTKRIANSMFRSSAIEAPLYGYTLQKLNADIEYNPFEDVIFNFGFDVFGGALTRTPRSYTTLTGKTEKDYINKKIENSKRKAEDYNQQKEIFDEIDDGEIYNETANLQEQRRTFFSMDEEINVIDGNSILNNSENTEIINRQVKILNKKDNITQEDFNQIESDVEFIENIIENENIKESDYENIDIDGLIQEKNNLINQFNNDSKTVKQRYENISNIDFKQRHEDIKRYGEIVKVIDNYNLVQMKKDLRNVFDAQKRGKNIKQSQKSAKNNLNNFERIKNGSRFTNTPYSKTNANFDIPDIQEIKNLDAELKNSKSLSKQKVKENIKDIDYNNKLTESTRKGMAQKASKVNKLEINNILERINENNSNLEKSLNNDIIRLERDTKELKNNVELSEQKLKEIRKKYGC